MLKPPHCRPWIGERRSGGDGSASYRLLFRRDDFFGHSLLPLCVCLLAVSIAATGGSILISAFPVVGLRYPWS